MAQSSTLTLQKMPLTELIIVDALSNLYSLIKCASVIELGFHDLVHKEYVSTVEEEMFNLKNNVICRAHD